MTLRARGHSIDAGLMQINDANWSWLGLTAATVFDPRNNVCAGMAVLAGAYAIERRVSCQYNTGRPDCVNSYPERVDAALRRVRAEGMNSQPSPITNQEVVAERTPTDPFVGHGPMRELMFVPPFRPVALPRFGVRPAVPAAPEKPIASRERGGDELVTMRRTGP